MKVERFLNHIYYSLIHSGTVPIVFVVLKPMETYDSGAEEVVTLSLQ